MSRSEPLIVDVRGKPCPKPVLETRDALSRQPAPEVVRVLVSNAAAVENVSRFARSQGWHVRLEDGPSPGERTLVLMPGGRRTVGAAVTESAAGDGVEQGECGRPPRIVVFVPQDTIGQGPEELGRILMVGFLKTLIEVAPRPDELILMNGGVRLACEGSECLDALVRLQDVGVEILACGTCLDYLGLREKLRVGRVSNMFEIASALVSADRLVRV